MITNIKTNWYGLEKAKLEKELNTDFKKGLSEKSVEGLREKYGKNVLASSKQVTFWSKLFSHLKSPLNFILIIAGVIAFVLGQTLDAMIIFLAVTINLVIGIFQENKADSAFEKLNNAQKKYATVIREGIQKVILSDELVRGDIVVLTAGEGIPADLRIIENNDLLINEATLTGEWIGVLKSIEPIHEKEASLINQTNLAWMGTLVSSGYGKGVVVEVGQNTQLGEISENLSDIEMSTPLKRKLNKLVRFLTIMVLISVVFIFFAGIFHGESYVDMFLIAIVVAISVIPEGLPAAMTSVLAVSMKEILKKGGLVKNLLASETLGNVSIILTDKTGTITMAEMKLSQIISRSGSDDDRKDILKRAVFSSDAFVERDEKSELIVHGRPLEKAILSAGLEQGISQSELEEEGKRLDLLLFSSDNGYALSLNKYKSGKNKIYVSGRPGILLEKSKFVLKDGKEVKMMPSDIKYFERLLEEKTNQGMRLTAIASKTVSLDKISGGSIDDLVFCGLLVFIDPIRDDVRESLKLSRELGVRTIMLTGDNQGTARKIAEEAGIIKKGGYVLGGSDTENMSDKELFKVLEKVSVFSRMKPSQKLRISKILKEHGEIIAMTGDGINDAPALRNANVGIAVESGTEVAKESADIILLDNSFSVIIAAIEEGRRGIDNLKKITAYLLSTSFSEVFVIGGALFFGLPLPVLASQILWINIIEEGLMNFSFVFEPKEKYLKTRDSFSADQEILTPKIKNMILIISLITGVFLTTLYFVLTALDLPLEEIRTIMFVSLSIDSLFFAFSLKSFYRPLWKINLLSNKFLIMAWLSGIGMIIASFSIPFLQKVLHTIPLNSLDFTLILFFGLFNICLIETVKYFFFERGSKHAY